MNLPKLVAWSAVAVLVVLLGIALLQGVTGGDFRPWLYVCVFPLVAARVAFRAAKRAAPPASPASASG